MYSFMVLLCDGCGQIFFTETEYERGLAVRRVMTATIILFLRRIIISGVCDNSYLAFDYSVGRQIDILDYDR